MSTFRTVRIHATLVDAIDAVIAAVKKPSGTPRYKSRAAFVETACEQLLEAHPEVAARA